MIIGFDISTSVIGWTVLDKEGKLVDIGHLDLRKKEDLYDKLMTFDGFLNGLVLKNYFEFDGISEIFVEEPLKMFMTGMSMANTISILQRFNGMVCSLLYLKHGIRPKLINASHARKLCGISLKKEKGKGKKKKTVKEQAFEHVFALNIVPESFWQKTKKGNFQPYCYDISDSYIVAKAGLMELK